MRNGFRWPGMGQFQHCKGITELACTVSSNETMGRMNFVLADCNRLPSPTKTVFGEALSRKHGLVRFIPFLFMLLDQDAMKCSVTLLGRGEQPTCDCKSAAASNLTCHGAWTLHQGRCYYFSKAEKNWTASQNFCSSHNATLAIIENEEKDFVMRLKGKDIFWIGLRRDPSEQWKGPNGENATLFSCTYQYQTLKNTWEKHMAWSRSRKAVNMKMNEHPTVIKTEKSIPYQINPLSSALIRLHMEPSERFKPTFRSTSPAAQQFKPLCHLQSLPLHIEPFHFTCYMFILSRGAKENEHSGPFTRRAGILFLHFGEKDRTVNRTWLEVLGKGGDCAYLNDEAKASSARCSIEHQWICIKAGLF
ncbi:C-type lectin domain family 2 member D [Varanus komodoensis]|nr:C-type lectin domain family 2 member D [Varanus komodoensis]